MDDTTLLLDLLRDDDTPLERVALAIAREGRRIVDEPRCLARLDELADSVEDAATARLSPRHAAAVLADHLHVRWGFRGNAEDYYDPRNSYLDEVLERRVGIPITLSILYVAIGRRLGIEVDGIGFPGRFLVRVGGPEGVIQDPFGEGAILDGAAIDELARRHGGRTRTNELHLVPVSHRAVALRMLVNLENAHARRGDHASALLACDRLVALTNDVARRRDRGLHAFALGAFAAAVDDLGAYVRERPSAPDRARVETVLVAARGRIRVQAN